VGLAPFTSGAVRLDGADLIQWDPDILGRYIGYLPQDVQLLAGTVGQNIGRMIRGAPSEAVLDAAQRAGVHDLVLRFAKGYDTEVGDNGQRLSAGQRQHIGLARAFYGNPPFIVLDEPNSNMDGSSEQALMKALRATKAAGTTLIVISHRPDTLRDADKLLVLRDGAVDLFGPAPEVLAKLGRPSAPPAPAAAPQPPRLPYPQFLDGLGRGPGNVRGLRADGAA
jgi:ABC-type protease/lipase transport system fused ATPase/permease subunit